MNDNLPFPPLVPLPIDVRPRLGETTINYVQRLARANHLKTSELIRILAPPPHTIGQKPALKRVAMASGRSTEVLALTLADATPAHLPVWTKPDLQLRNHASLIGLGFNKTGLIKHEAGGSKQSLRQIAHRWQVPLWLLKRILSPRFPNERPVPRSAMPEDTYQRIKRHYTQGLTATQSWRSFLDDHDTWLTLTTVTKLYLDFASSTPARPRHSK
ncbi:hypothetical protein ACFUTR_28985 [Streptomyces sp. NPDC057367]|uniref:hypothetical protein n=1 Tax=Streptomyces sp. NPDC057367 TaxID=3346108 RepID=UPI00363CDDC3